MLHCTEVKGKQRTRISRVVLLGTRVRPETKEAFRLLAAKEDRSASAELRRLIEQRVSEFEAELARAA